MLFVFPPEVEGDIVERQAREKIYLATISDYLRRDHTKPCIRNTRKGQDKIPKLLKGASGREKSRFAIVVSVKG